MVSPKSRQIQIRTSPDRAAVRRCGAPMVPSHATKVGIRYRYYVSLPHLYGESKTASVGSVSCIPATDIEDIVIKSLSEHLIAEKENPISRITLVGNRNMVLEQVARIEVHKDRLVIR